LATGVDPCDLGADGYGDSERAERRLRPEGLVAVVKNRHFPGMHWGTRELGHVIDWRWSGGLGNRHAIGWPLQAEHSQRISVPLRATQVAMTTGIDSDVLHAVDIIGHGRRVDRKAGLPLPEHLA